ncbi:MAG: hypothetical protein M3Q48_01275, partial [Actinomycetota bacterium]|nr:hypothetical protein [Actinomycetota bacterium]
MALPVHCRCAPSIRRRRPSALAVAVCTALVLVVTGWAPRPGVPDALQPRPAAADTTQTLRFLATADLHFESLGNNQTIGGTAYGKKYWSDLGSNPDVTSGDCPKIGLDDNNHCDNVTNVAVLKAMMDTMKNPGDVPVSGVITAGDQQRLTANDEWDAFRTIVDDYGMSNKVYEGLGNHDVNCGYRTHNAQPAGCWPQTQAQDIGSRVRAGTNFHTCYDELKSIAGFRSPQDCPSYAWDMGGVRFVQLNLYPQNNYTDIRVGSKITHHGLTFLQYDLARYAADGRPVVLVHHYGFDGFGTEDRWWTDAERLAYWNAIAPFNVVLIIQGHNHPSHFDNSARTTASPDIHWFNRPAAGDPRGGERIPSITAGPACQESCGEGPDDGGWWLDVTMTRTGNVGTISATQMRTQALKWKSKYTKPQTAANGFGIDVAVQYNDVTSMANRQYSSWTSNFAFQPPTSVAVLPRSSEIVATASPTELVDVELRDAGGNPLAGGIPVRVELSTDSPTGRFFVAGAPATSVTVPSGASRVSVAYGDTKPGYATLGAHIATKDLLGRADAPWALIRTVAGPAKHLVVTTPRRTVAAGLDKAGQEPITVELRDELGNPTTRMRNSSGDVVSVPPQQLQLASSAPSGYFSPRPGGREDPAACSSCYSIGGTASSASFYYGDTTPGSRSVSVTAAGLTGGQPVTVVAGAPAGLKLGRTSVTGSRTSPASANIGPIAVTLTDAVGNAAAAPTDVGVTLSSDSPTGVFAASRGGSPITSVTIRKGSSSTPVYYGDSTVGSPTLTAAAPSSGSATRTVTITDGAASGVRITSPALSATTSAQPVSGPLTVGLVNAAGDPTVASQRTVVELDTTSPGGSFGVHYAAIGDEVVDQVVIPAGEPSVEVFYGDRVAGNPLITVAASGLTSGTQEQRVAAGEPRFALFAGGPARGAVSARTDVGPFPVQLVDCFDNPTVAQSDTVLYVSSSAGLGTDTETAAGTSGTNLPVLVPAGASSTSVYAGGTRAGAVGMRVFAPGVVDRNCDPANPDRNPNSYQTLVLEPGPVARVGMLTGALTGPASSTAAVGPGVVQLLDAFDNPVSPAAATPLTVTAGSPTGLVASTPSGAAVTSITVPAGASQAKLWVGDTRAGSWQV